MPTDIERWEAFRYNDRGQSVADRIVRGILDDIGDRSGISDEFDAIDPETKWGIVYAWRKIIEERIQDALDTGTDLL